MTQDQRDYKLVVHRLKEKNPRLSLEELERILEELNKINSKKDAVDD